MKCLLESLFLDPATIWEKHLSTDADIQKESQWTQEMQEGPLCEARERIA